MWEVEGKSGELTEALLTLGGHDGSVYSVAWSPDGKRLATGSGKRTANKNQTGKVRTVEGAARVWRVKGKSGEPMEAVLNLTGHDDPVRSVAWRPDGKRLATASEDKSVKVWDARSGKELLTIRSNTREFTSVAWSSDGRRMAAANNDGSVQVYAMDPHLLLDLARSRIENTGRTLSPDECQRYFQSEKCPPLP